MIRAFVAAALLIGLAACTPQNLKDPPADLGNFSLGHNIVIASKMRKGPVSRDATEEEWTTNLKGAIADRFGRYEGDKLYHFGVSIEGYMLAPKGVPLVYTPKSALLVQITVWDDAKNKKMNSEPFLITAFEDTNEDSLVIGSGWGRTKNEQLKMLSYNAAYEIEKWLVENYKTLDWFTDKPAKEPPKQEVPQMDGI